MFLGTLQMGCGKTLTAIETACRVRDAHNASAPASRLGRKNNFRFVVVAPSKLVSFWGAEVKRWKPSMVVFASREYRNGEGGGLETWQNAL